MKKLLWAVARLLFFLAAFGAAAWTFMPWKEVGTAALSLGASGLEGQGVRLSFSDVTAAEGGFTVNGLSLGGLVNVTFQSLTLRPQLLASVMNLAPTCEVEFQGGAITMGQPMSFGDGGFLLTVSSREALLERLWANGDFALEGFLSFDRVNMRIGRADAALRVPSSFEGSMDMLRNFLPLVQEGDRWFLRRAGSDGGN